MPQKKLGSKKCEDNKNKNKSYWKENFCEYQREAHEGVKYPCGQCLEQFSQNGNLGNHQRQVYEGVNYPCNKCNYQATTNKNKIKKTKICRDFFY